MPTAIYTTYVRISPALDDQAKAKLVEDLIATIGKDLSLRQLEAAVDRQAQLPVKLEFASNAPAPDDPTEPQEGSIKVVDLRMRARRFWSKDFATRHSQLTKAEYGLSNYIEYRLDEELRKNGLTNGSELTAKTLMVGSGGFFWSGWSLFLLWVFGLALGAAALLALAALGVDLQPAVEALRAAAG